MKLYNQLKNIYQQADKSQAWAEAIVLSCIVGAIACAYLVGAAYYTY